MNVVALAKFATVANLADIADTIRELESRNVKLATATVVNVIAIAKMLGEARPNFKHGEWGPWLAAGFKWSDRTAARYWSVYKLTTVIPDLDTLRISVSVLYMMAQYQARSFFKKELPCEALTKLITLARTQRVTVEIAENIFSGAVTNASAPRPLSAGIKLSPVLTPREEAIKAENTRQIKEANIFRVVAYDLPTKVGLQALKEATTMWPNKKLRAIRDMLNDIIEERELYPSRFAALNAAVVHSTHTPPDLFTWRAHHKPDFVE